MRMKRFTALSLAAATVLTGCERLDLLTWDMTPERWLATHPHVSVRLGPLDFVLAEPSSSLIVFALGVVLTVAGIWFLGNRGASRSRLLWGIGFAVWAASTFCAGVSYQAFSYVLKCSGRTVCLWTTWWEIAYLMLFVASLNALVAAVAYSSSAGMVRKAIVAYAIANTAIYECVVLAGAFLPNAFLASFECMLLFGAPAFAILFAVNLSRWRKTKSPLELRLVVAWLLMFAVIVAYFSYFLSGISERLWASGVWFNANDVLHVGLILWTVYLMKACSRGIRDAEQGPV